MLVYFRRRCEKVRQRHKPQHYGCILFCILSLWREWKIVNKKCPLPRNGIWEVAATRMMLVYEHWDNESRRVQGMTTVGHSVWNGSKNEGRKKVNHKLSTESSKFLQWAHSFSSEQQWSRERHWDGMRYTDILPSQVSEGWKGRKEQKKEDKQTPSVSHTRATAAGKEPDLSWSICLCLFPLSENQGETLMSTWDVFRFCWL